MNTQSSYDRVADEYARRIYDELAGKPFDRLFLDWLIEKVNGRGVICEIGCGPGQIARSLSDPGAAACGVDLSAGMIAQARTLNPGLTFTQADMRTPVSYTHLDVYKRQTTTRPMAWAPTRAMVAQYRSSAAAAGSWKPST